MKPPVTLLAIFLSAASFAHPCPDRLETHQTLKKQIIGWEPFFDPNALQLLESVDFYDGPPKQMAQLVPDNSDSKNDPSWTFAPREGQKAADIWQVCRYTNTKVSLERRLPPGTKKCSITYSKTVTPHVDAIVCTP